MVNERIHRYTGPERFFPGQDGYGWSSFKKNDWTRWAEEHGIVLARKKITPIRGSLKNIFKSKSSRKRS